MKRSDLMTNVGRKVDAFKKGKTTESPIPPLKMSAKKTDKSGLFMADSPSDIIPVMQIPQRRYESITLEEMRQERRYFPDRTDKMCCRLMKACLEVQRLVYYAEEQERIKKDWRK